MQRDYIFFAGRRIAWRDSSGNVYYYFVDALGSTKTVTNATGTACFDADYYPYGQENDYSTSCSPTYKFTGYEYDSETGNYYAFARYYDPRIGRFMTTDPLAGDASNPQSLNRYGYVVNNPESMTDSAGMTGNGMGGGSPFASCIPWGILHWDYSSFDGQTIFIDSYFDFGGFICPGLPTPGQWYPSPGGGGTAGDGSGTSSPNFGQLVGQTLIALQNDNCAALFGGYSNAVGALLNTTYTMYSPSATGYAGLSSVQWQAVVQNFTQTTNYGYSFEFPSSPGGITFFGSNFSNLKPGFGAPFTDELKQETGFLHELEHTSTYYYDKGYSSLIDQNRSTDYFKINSDCALPQFDTQSAPISTTLVPPN